MCATYFKRRKTIRRAFSTLSIIKKANVVNKNIYIYIKITQNINMQM